MALVARIMDEDYTSSGATTNGLLRVVKDAKTWGNQTTSMVEDSHQYVHRCPFLHCHHHNHHNLEPQENKQAPTDRKNLSPTPPCFKIINTSCVSTGPTPIDASEFGAKKFNSWDLTSRGVVLQQHEERVPDCFRTRVIAYIVEQLSSKEVMQTRHAKERLRRTVAALEQTVYSTASQKQEYLKQLAQKLTAVYKQLQKEPVLKSSTINLQESRENASPTSIQRNKEKIRRTTEMDSVSSRRPSEKIINISSDFNILENNEIKYYSENNLIDDKKIPVNLHCTNFSRVESYNNKNDRNKVEHKDVVSKTL